MGTGQLNAFRLTSNSVRAVEPSAAVPSMGWDYRTVNAASYRDYMLAQPLKQGSFVALTLAWDRLVELNDTNKMLSMIWGEFPRSRLDLDLSTW